MVYKGLAAHPLLNPDLVAGRDLRDDLLDRIVMTVFHRGPEPIAHGGRVRRAHRRAARRHRACRRRKSRAACRRSLERLAPHPGRSLPKAAPPAAADIRAQLAWLMPAGFLLTTPWERLKEFPRYLQAIEQRLEKLPRESAARCAARRRDRAARSSLSRAGQGRARPQPPGEDEFRWLLEEFRVSLFAQQLRTRTRVSARRLEEAWAERQLLPPT